MKKNVVFFVIFLVVIVVFFWIYNKPDSRDINDIASPFPALTPSIPVQTYVHGEHTCLPHKSKTREQTLECALGIKSHEGDYYSLDLSQLPIEKQNLPTSIHMYVSGLLVPVEQLSSDYWQKYDIKGIIQVKEMGEHDY